MGNETRKTHFSHKELQCNNGRVTLRTTMRLGNDCKQGRLIVHTRRYNANNG
ncbi:hypothetical protein KSS87_015289 [Heliosperma pusillum]|nr:hypothetical protein KSS87_015289 [Heliosperma pusillum]